MTDTTDIDARALELATILDIEAVRNDNFIIKIAEKYIKSALLAAERRGEERMRERAAHEAEGFIRLGIADTPRADIAIGYARASEWIAHEIRNLKLSGDE